MGIRGALSKIGRAFSRVSWIRRYFGKAGLVLFLAGIVYFLAAFYFNYGEPITVMEQCVALVVAGLVLRLLRGSDLD